MIEPKAKHENESIVDYLSRMVHNLDYEHSTLLDDLTSIEAVIDFFDLWHIYDTETLDGIYEMIEEGKDPIDYNEFVKKYKLKWNLVNEKGEPISQDNESTEN